MIVYSKTQYLVLIPNTMVLEKEGNYFYIESSLYNNLVILNHQYEFNRVGELIGRENNLETIEWLKDQLPEPINILAPFLRLVSKEVEQDLELCVGSLHEIFCTGLNPYGFIKTPMEIRRDIEFGRTGNVYKEMWRGIMNQYVDYEEIMSAMFKPYVVSQPMQQMQPQYVTYENPAVEEPKLEDGEFQDIDENSFLFEDDEDDDVEPLDMSMFGGSNAEVEVEVKQEELKSVSNGDEGEDEMSQLMKVLAGGTL